MERGGLRSVITGGIGHVKDAYAEWMRNKRLQVVYHRHGLRVMTGTANPELATDVARILGTDLFSPASQFDNGEIDVNIPVSVRQHDVFIIQPTSVPDVNKFQMELCLLLDAARRASPESLTAFVTSMGYDRKDRPTDQDSAHATRQAVGAKVVVDQIFLAGADRIATFDIHADQIMGMTEAHHPIENLYGSHVLIPAIQRAYGERSLKGWTILSPDLGGSKRAHKWMELSGATNFASVHKERRPGKLDTYGMVGTVRERVLIVDDILSTGGSVMKAAQEARQNGAQHIALAVTHGEFINKRSNPAPCIEMLRDAGIEQIFVTDTIRQRPEVVQSGLVEVVSVAPLVAKAIKVYHTGGQIHGLTP